MPKKGQCTMVNCPRRLSGLLLAWVCCTLLLPHRTAGYSNGAPSSRCSSMIPGHGSSTKTYVDPFIVSVSSTTYSPLQLITVTIKPRSSLSNVYIRGFFTQARPANNRNGDIRLGFFPETSGAKPQCNSGAITHSYSTDRMEVTFTWRAPAGPSGDIVFRSTVVRRYSDYYTEVYSPVLSYQAPTTSTTTTTTIAITTTTTTTTTTATTTTTTPTIPATATIPLASSTVDIAQTTGTSIITTVVTNLADATNSTSSSSSSSSPPSSSRTTGRTNLNRGTTTDGATGGCRPLRHNPVLSLLSLLSIFLCLHRIKR